MPINTRAFTIAFTIIIGTLVLVISIWARLSSQFGDAFLIAFNSIHPHPFTATLAGLTALEDVFGVLLDTFYGVIDALIFSLVFCSLYNRLARPKDEPGEE